jgi:hypothetical protein
MSLRSVVLSVVTLALVSNVRLAAADRIGDLSTKSHGVSGTLHTLDDKTLFIQGFTYDGKTTLETGRGDS